MSFELLIHTHGYLALVAGTFLEGETVLILGGFLAHQGYLELPWVILSAFAGTFAGDQCFFYLGRFKGMSFIEKRPSWKAKSSRVFACLRNHPFPVVFGFRFLYGIRSVTPFIIGASGVGPVKFFCFNGLGAGVWAVSVGWLGYLFGQTLSVFMARVKTYESWVAGAVILAGVALWVAYFLVDRKRKRAAGEKAASPGPPRPARITTSGKEKTGESSRGTRVPPGNSPSHRDRARAAG